MDVVVAEDNGLLRQGMVQLLTEYEFDVVGSCGTAEEAQRVIDATRPAVVITDIRMPPTNTTEGLDLAAWLAVEHPGTGVVVLSQHVTPAYAVRLLHDGPPNRAYLLKERVSDIGELVRAVREVHEGGSVIDPLVVDALVSASRKEDSALGDLTPRGVDVLSEMATGKANHAVAEALGLSQRSIEKHSNSIFAKLGFSEEPGLNRRVAAVILFLDQQRSATA